MRGYPEIGYNFRMPPTASALVASNVRAEMTRCGVTQVQLAEVLGLTQPAISRRTRGEVAFRFEELVACAAVFDTTVSRLTDGLDASAGAA